jgi:hypothetical protein
MFDDKKQVGLKAIGKRDFNAAVTAVKAVTDLTTKIGALEKKIGEEQEKGSEDPKSVDEIKKFDGMKAKLVETLPNLQKEAREALSILSNNAVNAIPGAEDFR